LATAGTAVPVIVGSPTYLVVALSDHFPDHLHDPLELLDRTYDPAFNKLEFRRDGATQFVHGRLIGIDVVDSVRSFGVLR